MNFDDKKEFNRVLHALLIIVFLIASIALLFTISPNTYNAITGAATTYTTVNITQSIPAKCNVTFPAGWNLVSFFSVPL